ncbi:hypothetical protein [Cohnella panacarvi]|uniref:hypothetical protein n=1 Tax=Cohnella panacarvi TaxID=400776 RepID=UPI00047D3525|nr:hypothetical protein [Cohnella panacarvi]
MKGLYRLINVEFGMWLRFLAALCASTIVLPLLILNAAAEDYAFYASHARFEHLYSSSGCSLLFLGLLLLLCLYFLKSVYAGYWGSKSVYTYLSLPVARESLYFAKLIVFMIGCLLLFAAQLVSIRLGYSLAMNKAETYMEGRYVMNNGLFLAFARSEFLRVLLPMTFTRILSSLGMLLVIVTGVYYGALCERSRTYIGFVPIAVAGWMLYRTLAYRLNEPIHSATSTNLYPSSLLFFALSCLFVWHGVRLMKRGSIA